MLKGTGCIQVEGSLRDRLGWQLPMVAQTMVMVQVHRVGRSRLLTIEDITVQNMDLQVLAGLSDMVHAVNKFGICMDCLMPSAVCKKKVIREILKGSSAQKRAIDGTCLLFN